MVLVGKTVVKTQLKKLQGKNQRMVDNTIRDWYQWKLGKKALTINGDRGKEHDIKAQKECQRGGGGG